MSHFTYNMMLVGVALLRSSESYYQISGWIVVLTLMLPLMPGILLTIRRYMRNDPALPENLTLSPLEKTDLVQLSILPVKVEWQMLAEQVNRTILCLRAGIEIIGFATGFVDDKAFGYVDGIYVTPKWRRQYWGSTLLNAIQDALKNCGAAEVRIAVQPVELRTRSFFHNQFWHASLHILTRDKSEQTFRSAIKRLTNDLRKEKTSEHELEIPRNLI